MLSAKRKPTPACAKLRLLSGSSNHCILCTGTFVPTLVTSILLWHEHRTFLNTAQHSLNLVLSDESNPDWNRTGEPRMQTNNARKIILCKRWHRMDECRDSLRRSTPTAVTSRLGTNSFVTAIPPLQNLKQTEKLPLRKQPTFTACCRLRMDTKWVTMVERTSSCQAWLSLGTYRYVAEKPYLVSSSMDLLC